MSSENSPADPEPTEDGQTPLTPEVVLDSYAAAEQNSANELVENGGTNTAQVDGAIGYSVQGAEQRLGRLHPLSLAFDIASHIRTFILPAIIAVFSAARDNPTGLIIAGLLFFPTVVRSFVRFFSLRYRIHGSELVVTEGIFFRRIRTVPVERIQNIDLIQSLVHRIFRVAEVRIETASGTEPEAVLRVLSLQKIEQLRTSIFQNQPNESEESTGVTDQSSTDLETEAKLLLAIPTIQLIKAGLASNKGTLLIGVLLGLYFQFNDQFEKYFDLRDVFSDLSQQFDSATLVVFAVAAVIFIFLFFRCLGVAWYLLRFSGYRLTLQQEDLRIQCGLLTMVSATVPRKRIQFVSIYRNWLMRRMKLAAIRIETAGAAGSGKEDAAKTVSSRWFVPVLPENQVKPLVEALRPGLNWDEAGFHWRPISPLAARRCGRLAAFQSVVIAGVGLAVAWPWGWVAGALLAPLLVWLAIRKAKSKRYARSGDAIVYRSGVLTRKTSITFFEKIQTVYWSETPFDRRWKMATLCVDTAAAGPADHLIHIKYLESEFAQEEFNAIVKQASEHSPVFS